MALFGNKIDVNNPTKTTYSEDDIRNLELTYQKEFSIKRGQGIHSPIRKELPKVLRTQIRDFAFDEILNKGMYSFKHVLVVPNPYGGSIQTALVLFCTKEELTCCYELYDEKGETIFQASGVKGTKHRVPVILLNNGKTNKLTLTLVNDSGEVVKRRPLTIYSREVSYRMINLLKNFSVEENEEDDFEPPKETKVDKSEFDFLLVNGMNFNPLVIDKKTNIRYSLQLRTTKTGMIPFKDEHFLLPDKMSNAVSANGERYCSNYLELDYLGRVYKSYYFKYPFGKVFCYDGDKLYFVTGKDKGYNNDWIVCFDTSTGEIVHEYSIAALVGDRYKTETEWVKITRIEVKGDTLLIVLKNLHTIISTETKNFNINWVIAPKDVWAGSPIEKYVLHEDDFVVDEKSTKPFLPDEEACRESIETYTKIIRPVFASVIDEDEKEEYVAVYSTQFRIPEELSDKVLQEETSQFSILKINKIDKSFAPVNVIRTKMFYRNGSVIFSDDLSDAIIFGGLSGRRKEKIRGNIVEFVLRSHERLRRVGVKKVYNNGWKFNPNVQKFCEPIEKNDDVIFGDILSPKKISEDIKATTEEKLKKKFFGNVYISGGYLCFSIRTNYVNKVYLKGEKNTYVMDYRDVRKREKKDVFIIRMHDLPKDTYYIYVECEGKTYAYPDEIRCEKK